MRRTWVAFVGGCILTAAVGVAAWLAWPRPDPRAAAAARAEALRLEVEDANRTWVVEDPDGTARILTGRAAAEAEAAEKAQAPAATPRR